MTEPKAFQFTPDQRVTLLAAALRGFIPLKFQVMPPRWDAAAKTWAQGKAADGQFGRVAAAWALDTVDSIEYRIRSDLEYREKRAAEARGKFEAPA